MTLRSKAILAAFTGTQVLDGALTFAGVTMGLASEANPIIAGLAGHVGLVTALFVVKTVACLFGVALAATGRSMLLAFLTLFYWGVAILPWLLILRVVSF